MTRHRVWCRPDALVVISADAPGHMHEAIADAVRADAGGLDPVLNALTSDGLAATPTFLCAAPDVLGLRVIVRGETQASVVAIDGTRSPLDAGRASTWNDDVVSDVSHIELVDDGDVWLTWVASSGTTGATVPPATLTEPAVPADEPIADPDPDPDRESEDAGPTDDGSHTLDEAAFQRLVEREDEPDHPAPDDDGPDDDREATSGDAPAVEAASPRDRDGDAADYSGLLSSTSQLTATPPPSAPSPVANEPTSDAPTSHAPEAAPPPDPTPAEPTPPRDTEAVPTAGGPSPSGPAPSDPAPSDPAPSDPQRSDPPPSAPAGAERPTSLITAVPVPTGSTPDPEPADRSAPPESAPPMVDTGLGEHDGLTITVADLARQATLPEPTSNEGVTVQAVHCPVGHPNPVAVPTCRVCAQPIADRTSTSIHRPVIARMVFDSGLIVDVDRPQLIGRRPTVAADAGGEIPNLVALPSPDGDLSRQHAAVHVEGWDVLVEDLGSTNGTELELPGQPPVRLRSHEQTLATHGSTVVLAGTVRFHLAHPDH